MRRSRSVRVVSFGWAGARVADLPNHQVRHATAPTRPNARGPFLPDADIVAVVIGSNDATHRTPPGRYRADLRAGLEEIRAQAPNARIVLAGIPAFRGALPTLEPLIFLADQYGRLLRPISRDEAARIGAAYADLQSGVPLIIGRREDSLSSDRFHPSVVGYDAWAEVIFQALQLGPFGGRRRGRSIAPGRGRLTPFKIGLREAARDAMLRTEALPSNPCAHGGDACVRSWSSLLRWRPWSPASASPRPPVPLHPPRWPSSSARSVRS